MQLTVDSVDDNTIFTVFAPDRTVLGQIWTTDVEDGTFWTGTLPTAGDYSIEITSLGGPAFYRMKVWIDAGYVDPLGLVQRLSFAPGTDNATRRRCGDPHHRGPVVRHGRGRPDDGGVGRRRSRPTARSTCTPPTGR